MLVGLRQKTPAGLEEIGILLLRGESAARNGKVEKCLQAKEQMCYLSRLPSVAPVNLDLTAEGSEAHREHFTQVLKITGKVVEIPSHGEAVVLFAGLSDGELRWM